MTHLIKREGKRQYYKCAMASALSLSESSVAEMLQMSCQKEN